MVQFFFFKCRTNLCLPIIKIDQLMDMPVVKPISVVHKIYAHRTYHYLPNTVKIDLPAATMITTVATFIV